MVPARFNPDLNAACQPAAPSRSTRAVAVSSELRAAPRTLRQILEATAEAFPEAIAMDDGRSC
jgi:hypothetical protein